jgi:N utilization substance protein B
VSAEPRDKALQALYEAEQREVEHPGAELTGKARRLVEGVRAHMAEIDEALEATAKRWRVERMPPVDRSILRLGLFELRYEPATPAPVVLSEAVRLAKTYSTQRSSAFVNGVLGTLAATERADEQSAGGAPPALS